VRTGWRRGVFAVAIGIGLIGAACGGGEDKAANVSTTTTSEVATQGATTTSTLATSETTTGGATSASSSTVTTARAAGGSTTKTTARRTTGSTALAVSKPVGGIGNVVSTSSTAPNKDIQPGGTLVMVKAGEMAGFDPPRITNSGANDAAANSAVFDMLFYSQNGSILPQTAQSLTSSDALVWTLKLNPNIKFTDGTPYDAAAVKYNWERIADPANAAPRAAQAALIASMDVVDSVTLRVTLKAKNALFPGAAANIPFIGSPAAIRGKGATNFNTDPVGAGPFTVKSWQRDNQIVLQRNPNYWRAPRPYLDQLILRVIIDESQRVNTMKSGEAQLALILSLTQAQQTQKDGSVPYTIALNGGFVLNFNTTKPPFNDLRARQAVAMALDLKDYTKVISLNAFDPFTSVFRKESPFYDPSIVQTGFDRVKAQQLFDQLASETGGPMKFPISTFPATNFQAQAQYVQGILNGYKNVDVSFVTESAQAHITNCNTRAFTGICHTAIPFDDPDPTWVNQLVCNAPVNPTGWCNSKFDGAVADNRLTLDANQRITDIKDAQREFYKDIPAFFIESYNQWWSAVPQLQDLELANDGLTLLDRVWLKTH
jgi:peptide/nickel transport system substrate-binding protein